MEELSEALNDLNIKGIDSRRERRGKKNKIKESFDKEAYSAHNLQKYPVYDHGGSKNRSSSTSRNLPNRLLMNRNEVGTSKRISHEEFKGKKSVSGSIHSKESKRHEKTKDRQKKSYPFSKEVPRRLSINSRSISSSSLSINDLYSSDSEGAESFTDRNSSSFGLENITRYHNIHGHQTRQRNSYNTETFSVYYIQKLTEKKAELLPRILSSQMKEFQNFFDSPLKKDDVVQVIQFTLRLCSIQLECSKKELLSVVVGSIEFIRSISNFIDTIAEFSRTLSQTERNLKLISMFFVETTYYVPSDRLLDFNDLILKTIHVLKKMGLSNDYLNALELCRALLSKKLILLDNKLITYKTLNVFPSEKDLSEEVLLRPNVVNGPYNSVEDYIDIQFKLLKEDFVSGLRSGLSTYLTQLKEKSKIRNREIFIYNNVIYKGVSEDLNPSKKLTHIFDLDKKHLSKVQWDVTRRLIHGSLILFSNDNFKTYFMGVFDDRLRFSSSSTAYTISVILIGKSIKLKKSSQYCMVESRVFFEPYYHVLNVLKNIHSQTFPMEKYIISVETLPKKPNYLSKDAYYEISDIEIPINNLDSWPSPEIIGLNQSQLEALQAALTREFVVIQGPPGTGKTYLGIKLIEILLNNKEHWSDGKSSIFVSCYRNNAVDQILNNLASNKRNVVRLGGRSGSEILKDSTLKNTVGHLRDPIMYSMLNVLKEELIGIKQKINELQKIKDFANENQGILSLEVFNKIMAPNHYKYLSGVNCYEDWLLGGKEEDLYNGLDTFLSSPLVEKAKKSSLPKDHQFVFISAKGILQELDYLEEELERYKLTLFEIYGSFDIPKNPEEIAILTDLLTQYNDKLIYLKILLRRLNQKQSETQLPNLLKSDLDNLSICERWTLYKYWTKEFINLCESRLEHLIEEHDIKIIDFLEKRDVNDGENLRRANVDVIGATTTGAARLNKLLSIAKPKIVILEEAAEVLEAHAIASLTEHCEHLILIGDHKQLRPSPASHSSCVRYNLDVSLFERMIRNGMDCFTLSEQHRMRPEISALVVPQIYPVLSNHPSVEEYPPLRGVKKSLFFIDHRISEDELKDDDSHQNKFEAYFILALAEYLIKQGYDPKSITVLTMYAAQLMFMKSIKKKYQNIEDVEIQVVDNFQGEENDIILLSLVRSNSSTIGFLSKENRVCVALSRAKQGFVMIGNMETLQLNSNVWKQMKQTLENASSLGECLPLKCKTHNRITKVKTMEDFKPLRNGGCSFECAMKLNCGHTCNFLCHPTDEDHEVLYTCQQPCQRKRNCGIHDCSARCGIECPPCNVLIPIDLSCAHKGFKICAGEVLLCKENCSTILLCGHSCPKKCHFGDDNHDECSAICNKPNESCPTRHPCPKICGEDCGECILETLIELDCGHFCKGVCRDVRKTHCEVLVDKDLNCGHYVRAPCYQPTEKIKCKEEMKYTLDCSHEVVALCGTPKEALKCNVEVERMLPCGHKQTCLCSTPLNELDCSQSIMKVLNCGHEFENAPCSSKLEELKCLKDVSTSLSCGHNVTVKCFSTKSNVQCPIVCDKLLSCGHKCKGLCGQKCPPCKVLIKIKDTCGHDKLISCLSSKGSTEDEKLGNNNCAHVCNQLLRCGHTCKGTCGECMQGRIHVMCTAQCNKQLICGHRCTNKCWNDFHSCNNKCFNTCKHDDCKKKCGDICTKCKEPCDWACSHYKCTKKCWEVCDRPPCMFPCQLTLSCSHPCFGFCGERCPPVCLICKPNKEFNVQDRFIFLEDCGHVIPHVDASALLLKNVGIIVCPMCNSPIVKTNFFRGHAKLFLRKYSKVKTKAQDIYNTKGSIIGDFRNNFKLLNKVLRTKYDGCDSLNKLLQNLVFRTMPILQYKQNNENKLSLKTLLFLCFYVTEALKMTKVDDLDEKHSAKLLLRINHLAGYLFSTSAKISPSQTQMFYQELIRLRCIIDLMQLEQDRNFEASEAGNSEYYKLASSSAFGFQQFSIQEKANLVYLLEKLKKHLSSNYILMSTKDDDFGRISTFFSKYNLITFHAENWHNCSKNHFFYSDSLEEQKTCPICSNNPSQSLCINN